MISIEKIARLALGRRLLASLTGGGCLVAARRADWGENEASRHEGRPER